jgi:hypothetical protein
MSSSTIGSGNVTSDYGNGISPTDEQAGEMAGAAESAPSQSETIPPSSTEEESPTSLNCWGGSEDDYSDWPDFFDSDSSEESDDEVTNTEVTQVEILKNPDVLPEAGTQGLEVTEMDLTLDSDGNLSEESKQEVNELIGNLGDRLGGIEVVANAYEDGNGDDQVKLHLTSGDENSVSYYPKDNSVYCVHTHPDGSTVPSVTDYANELDDAEDAIVPADGTPGNEDGSDYIIYA